VFCFEPGCKQRAIEYEDVAYKRLDPLLVQEIKLEIIDPNGLWTDNKPFEIGVGYVHISPLKCITADDLFPHCSICGAVVYLSERGFICPTHGIVESKEIDLRQRDS